MHKIVNRLRALNKNEIFFYRQRVPMNHYHEKSQLLTSSAHNITQLCLVKYIHGCSLVQLILEGYCINLMALYILIRKQLQFESRTTDIPLMKCQMKLYILFKYYSSKSKSTNVQNMKYSKKKLFLLNFVNIYLMVWLYIQSQKTCEYE